MNCKENVIRAVGMKRPDSLPFLYINKDKCDSDAIIIDVEKHFIDDRVKRSEWGFEWKKIDETMGQPRGTVIKTWEDLNRFTAPDPNDLSRFSSAIEDMQKYPGKFYIASLGLSGFTIMTFLRGFSNVLEDILLEDAKIGRLADIVFGFEEEIIKQLKNYGFDAVAFYDDWGTQNNLIISPKLWRSFFKPRYKRQFDLAHRHGLYTYFHSCGYIYDIIGDLIEIGMDMFNMAQPNVYDIKKLGAEYAGKTCFVCPISYQTTAISGNMEDIYEEAERLLGSFWDDNGGFIAYIEAYESIGLSRENYRHCINAFKTLSKTVKRGNKNA